MNKDINYNYKLPPFKWFCLTNFPFIEADFDAITNYELLCKIVQYLNEVIVKTNATGEQVENLTNAINDLYEWFENLDVQEEINNKLDDMAESGELADIISEYLNSIAIFGFDNVVNMKSATNLIDGSYAKTMGYYTKNDGGSANYKIRTITNEDVVDNAKIIALNNPSLVAELIIPDVLNPEIFGAKGDGTTDDTDALQKALLNGKKVYLANKTYLISEQITIDNGSALYCENGIIKASSDFYGDSMLLIGHDDDTPTNVLTLKNQNVNMKIKLDLNGKANLIGVLVSRSYRNNYDIIIKNCAYIGVKTNYDNDNQSAENTYRISGINQRNSNFVNTILLESGGSDDIFDEVTGANFKIGVHNVGNINYFNVVHCWITDNDLFDGSILFNTEYGEANINNLYCDGLQTAIQINHPCNRFNVRDCLLNYNPLSQGYAIKPLKAHTTDTVTKFSKGSINFSSSINSDILIDSQDYDNTFAGLVINAPNLCWKSDNGNTAKMFQTNAVSIGSSLSPQTGLINRDSHLPLDYNGYYLTATCKRTMDNYCTQELNSTNGNKYFKTCVNSTPSAIDTGFATNKWYTMVAPE